jgi:hypothetical protein
VGEFPISTGLSEDTDGSMLRELADNDGERGLLRAIKFFGCAEETLFLATVRNTCSALSPYKRKL